MPGAYLDPLYALVRTYTRDSTVMSPAVLERSGIGRKDVLDQVGVPLKVNLPGVGENVQDHVYACQFQPWKSSISLH